MTDARLAAAVEAAARVMDRYRFGFTAGIPEERHAIVSMATKAALAAADAWDREHKVLRVPLADDMAEWWFDDDGNPAREPQDPDEPREPRPVPR